MGLFIFIVGFPEKKRQKAEEILCFRLDTILWVFLCAHIAHKQDRDEEREIEGGKTCEAAGKQHQLLNILFVFHIKSHSFSSTFLV